MSPSNATPARYVVLGNPVEHSQSPFIHAEFARQTGEPIEYGRLLCALDGFEAAVRGFAARRGSHGCNVTMPFKFQAPALAARLGRRAALAQAANVLRFDADGWFADNTDGIGLVRDIEVNAGCRLSGSRVLLVGAGGGAAGVLGPLIEAGATELVLANRTPSRAVALVERHAEWARRHRCHLVARPLAEAGAGAGFDVVVNASGSSLAGADVPVDASVLHSGTLAVDLMYGPASAAFVGWADDHGAVGRDGLGMLVEQAAEAFLLWRGVRPHTPPVLAALREHLAGH